MQGARELRGVLGRSWDGYSGVVLKGHDCMIALLGTGRLGERCLGVTGLLVSNSLLEAMYRTQNVGGLWVVVWVVLRAVGERVCVFFQVKGLGRRLCM